MITGRVRYGAWPCLGRYPSHVCVKTSQEVKRAHSRSCCRVAVVKIIVVGVVNSTGHALKSVESTRNSA